MDSAKLIELLLGSEQEAEVKYDDSLSILSSVITFRSVLRMFSMQFMLSKFECVIIYLRMYMLMWV